jgi:hypothetical protein
MDNLLLDKFSNVMRSITFDEKNNVTHQEILDKMDSYGNEHNYDISINKNISGFILRNAEIDDIENIVLTTNNNGDTRDIFSLSNAILKFIIQDKHKIDNKHDNDIILYMDDVITVANFMSSRVSSECILKIKSNKCINVVGIYDNDDKKAYHSSFVTSFLNEKEMTFENTNNISVENMFGDSRVTHDMYIMCDKPISRIKLVVNGGSCMFDHDGDFMNKVTMLNKFGYDNKNKNLYYYSFGSNLLCKISNGRINCVLEVMFENNESGIINVFANSYYCNTNGQRHMFGSKFANRIYDPNEPLCILTNTTHASDYHKISDKKIPDEQQTMIDLVLKDCDALASLIFEFDFGTNQSQTIHGTELLVYVEQPHTILFSSKNLSSVSTTLHNNKICSIINFKNNVKNMLNIVKYPSLKIKCKLLTKPCKVNIYGSYVYLDNNKRSKLRDNNELVIQ